MFVSHYSQANIAKLRFYVKITVIKMEYAISINVFAFPVLSVNFVKKQINALIIVVLEDNAKKVNAFATLALRARTVVLEFLVKISAVIMEFALMILVCANRVGRETTVV